MPTAPSPLAAAVPTRDARLARETCIDVHASTRHDRVRRLVEEHVNVAARMLRHVGVPEAAVEDLLQQSFQICAARIDDIQPGKERSFLIETAIRVAANARRRSHQTHEVFPDRMPDIADAAPTPEEELDQRRKRQRLDAILSAMDFDERTVFVLYEIEEMTMAEIAVVLRVPAGTVASRLRRAREDFLKRAERDRRADARAERGVGK